MISPVTYEQGQAPINRLTTMDTPMPPPPLVDLTRLDLEKIQFGPDEIRRRNPHRHEMELLDGIIHFDPEEGEIVGFHDIGDDEFWVRGHIPERPLFPGVLMVEAAAQLCSFYFMDQNPEVPFFGFAGIENVRFRHTVVPGQRLLILGRRHIFKARRASFNTQGYVDGKMAFEARIIGMKV